jgi:putative nucleotidyltransferase with HDIG domain
MGWYADEAKTSQDGPVTSVNVCCGPHSVERMNLGDWGEETARTVLEIPLPRRWAHSRGVAVRARDLAPVLGKDAELVEAAAWLHDIGYAPDLAVTGFHPLDGARYLRDVQHASPVLCALVAHHSCAAVEAEERGLADELAGEFPAAPDLLLAALTYCDMTTSPDGDHVSFGWRIEDIHSRYGPTHRVTRAIGRALPQLTAAVGVIGLCQMGAVAAV